MKFFVSFFLIFFSLNLFGSVVRPTHFPQTNIKYLYVPSFQYSYSLPIKITNTTIDNIIDSQLSKSVNEEATKAIKDKFTQEYRDRVIRYGQDLGTQVDGSIQGHGIGYEVEVPFRTWMNLGFSIMTKFALRDGFFKSYPDKRISVDLTFFPRFQLPITDFKNFFSSIYLKTGIGLSTNLILTDLPRFTYKGKDDAEVDSELKNLIFKGAMDRSKREGDKREEPSLPLMGLGVPIQAEIGLDFYIGQWFSITAGYSFTWMYLFEFALNFSNDGDMNEFIDGFFGINTYEHAIHIGIKSTYF